MADLKTITGILGGFDRVELSSFEKYVDSPFFIRDDQLKNLLWNCIRKSQHDTDQNQKNIENLYISKLWKEAETTCYHFLIQQEFDKLTTLKANLNLAGIKKRNIDRLYKDALSNIEKLEKSEFDQSSEYFYYRSLIEKNIFELKTENEKKNAKVKIASELNMHKISENVDLFYILEIMKIFIQDFITEGNKSLFPELEFALKAAESLSPDYQSVTLYKMAIENILKKNKDPKSWKIWLDYCDQFGHKIPQEEMQDLMECYNVISGYGN